MHIKKDLQALLKRMDDNSEQGESSIQMYKNDQAHLINHLTEEKIYVESFKELGIAYEIILREKMGVVFLPILYR